MSKISSIERIRKEEGILDIIIALSECAGYEKAKLTQKISRRV